MSPADQDSIRRGPNEPITPEENEQVVLGKSNITDAGHFAQAHNIFHMLHLPLYLKPQVQMILTRHSRSLNS